MSTQRKSSMVLFFVFLLSLVVAPLSGQSREEDYPDSFAEEPALTASVTPFGLPRRGHRLFGNVVSF